MKIKVRYSVSSADKGKSAASMHFTIYRQQAQVMLSTFPKSTNVKASGLYFYHRPSYRCETVPTLVMYVKLSADDVNQGANETGMRRIRSFFAALHKLGEVELKQSKSSWELPAEIVAIATGKQ